MFKEIITATVAALWVSAAPLWAQDAQSQVPPMPEALKNMEYHPSLPAGTATLMPAVPMGTLPLNGKDVPLYGGPPPELGLLLPDGQGGMVWQQSGLPRVSPSAETVDSRELKLKIRDLADQLVSHVGDSRLRNMVALPTTFVDQDNFTRTSSFGRFIAEQLFYEFNQRGFPVREYRAEKAIHMEPGQGDFLLSRALGSVSVQNALAIVGTYYQDQNAVFVSARLIRGSDGRVLRTGQLVLPLTGVTRRMLARNNRVIPNAVIGIRGIKDASAAAPESVLDQGYDLH